MTKIRVDFNNLVRQGQVRASLRHADGAVTEGQTVEAFDPEEGLSYAATVVQVDDATGRIYLQPHWEPAEEATPVSRMRIGGIGLQSVNGTNAVVRHLEYHPRLPAVRVSEGVLVTS